MRLSSPSADRIYNLYLSCFKYIKNIWQSLNNKIPEKENSFSGILLPLIILKFRTASEKIHPQLPLTVLYKIPIVNILT